MKNTIIKISVTIFVCLAFMFSAFVTLAETTKGKTITVEVSVDSSLLPDNASEWPLYVYAAKPNTRLPLSSFKGKLSDLPLKVTLDESMFLLPHLTIKDADEVVVVAKASKNKDPHKKSAEDLIVFSEVLSFKADNSLAIKLNINQKDRSVKNSD